MIRRLTILLLIVGCVFAREYIAIIDFEGISISEADAKALTQRLTSEMIKLELYQVLERSEMKRLLEEQKFQYSGCVDLNCAVELGKMLGAKYMVVGSISKVGNTYSIDSRLIDVKTSESYVSASYSMKGEIDGLMDVGMKSIAHQLCEMKYDKPFKENEITNNILEQSGDQKLMIKQDDKSPLIAGLFSLVPTMGHIYLGEWNKRLIPNKYFLLMFSFPIYGYYKLEMENGGEYTVWSLGDGRTSEEFQNSRDRMAVLTHLSLLPYYFLTIQDAIYLAYQHNADLYEEIYGKEYIRPPKKSIIQKIIDKKKAKKIDK